jgi:hypothetical protein
MNFSMFVRSVKGAPLSILLTAAYHDADDTVLSESFISSVCGYSVKTVRSAALVLVGFGLFDRVGRYGGYELTDYGRSLITTITSTIVGTSVLMTEENKAEVKSTVRMAEITARKVDQTSPVYQYLTEVGVGEPTRSRIMRLEWVNLDYLVAHFRQGVDDPIGLIIHRIMNHDPLPRAKITVRDTDYYRKAWGKGG